MRDAALYRKELYEDYFIGDLTGGYPEIPSERYDIVVCEQVLSFVLDIADRIIVMEGGRIVHSDTRDHVDEAAVARFLAV